VALAGGFGFFFIEFEVLGLTGDDVQGEPGAFFGFRGKEVAGEVRKTGDRGPRTEDGGQRGHLSPSLSLRGRCETVDHGFHNAPRLNRNLSRSFFGKFILLFAFSACMFPIPFAGAFQ